MSERSSETYAIKAAKPVVSRDIAKDEKFDVPQFMKQVGVVALVNVPIFVPGQRPYGILQVDDTKPWAFGDEEIEFLRTYAVILGPVIDQLHLVEKRAKDQELLKTTEARQEIADDLLRIGAELLGPVSRVSDALRLIDMQRPIDAALLGVNLSGVAIWPVVDVLLARSVPLILATGYDAGAIPAAYAHLPRCEKPTTASDMTRALVRVLTMPPLGDGRECFLPSTWTASPHQPEQVS